MRLKPAILALFLAAPLSAQVKTRVSLGQKDTAIITAKKVPPVIVHDTTVVVHTDTVRITKCFDQTLTQISCPTVPSVPPDTSHPIPPTPVDSTSHEPAGFVKVLEWDASSSPVTSAGSGGTDHLANGWTVTYDHSLTPPLFAFTQDATATRSPAGVIQERFQAGFGGSASPAIVEKGFSNSRSVYISYWVKISSNWVGHRSSGVNKQIYAWTGSGRGCIYTTAQGNGSDPLQPEVHLQCEPTINLVPNLGVSRPFTRGVWHRWEMVLVGNTAGQSDGLVDFWLDGVKLGHYANVKIENGAVTFSVVQISPVYGGGSDSPNPFDMFAWFDHIYISAKP